MTPNDRPALEARFSLSVGSGPAAFRVEAEFTLDAGVLVLYGPSGSGKSLTLLALAGLVAVTTGHLIVGEATLLDTDRGIDVPPHLRRVGYVPQRQALFPFLDVVDNVAFSLPRGAPGRARALALLEEVGAAHLARSRPESLSGGERQRVALARALAAGPRILLLDEPFASVDEDGARDLRMLVRDTVRRQGIPAVLVTHDAAEAESLGDRLVRFARGRTLTSGTPEKMLEAGGSGSA